MLRLCNNASKWYGLIRSRKLPKLEEQNRQKVYEKSLENFSIINKTFSFVYTERKSYLIPRGKIDSVYTSKKRGEN